MLLFPDPRPLVERLGLEFFRQAPECPGVYLMRDASETVLYVGKAKNLRKRFNSYRVANPDRLRRRHLRLLRAVARIEFERCPDEVSALKRESELLQALRPRFNRAGTWAGPPRFLAWRVTGEGLDLAVAPAAQDDWFCHGPMGAGAFPLHASLVRLFWCAIHPQRGLAGMPAGWFRFRHSEPATIPRHETTPADFEVSGSHMAALFTGQADEFAGWIRERTATQAHPFECAVREADLETVNEFAQRITHYPHRVAQVFQPAVSPAFQPGNP
jgi:predicted GIY-YIG superfamily endonuclease